MKELKEIFNIYRPQGIIKSIWTVTRIFLLPYKKLDKIMPTTGVIVDIGCGNGGLANYLALRSGKRNLKGIDLSKKRIASAIKSIGKRKNVEFIYGDAASVKLPKVDCYLMVDVLHHISFEKQEKLISFLAKQVKDKSMLIIKEVDPSNHLPFLFGHIIEKILYPREHIYTRTKKDWLSLFKSLGLNYKVESGIYYFPDSTCIFTLSSKNN